MEEYLDSGKPKVRLKASCKITVAVPNLNILLLVFIVEMSSSSTGSRLLKLVINHLGIQIYLG